MPSACDVASVILLPPMSGSARCPAAAPPPMVGGIALPEASWLARIAAPSATASSTFTPASGGLPVMRSTYSWT